MFCCHSKYAEIFIRNRSGIGALCLKCVTNDLLSTEASRIARRRSLRELIDRVSDSDDIAFNFHDDQLEEIALDLTKLIKSDNLIEDNDQVCNVITIFFAKFDRDKTCLMTYLNLLIDQIESHCALENRLRYIMFIKYFAINFRSDFINFIQMSDKRLVRCLVAEICAGVDIDQDRMLISAASIYMMIAIIDNDRHIVTILDDITESAADLMPHLVTIIAMETTVRGKNISAAGPSSDWKMQTEALLPICESLFTNAILLIILLIDNCDSFQNRFLECDQTALILRKLIVLPSEDGTYCKYGLRIIDALLSSERNGETFTQYLSQTSNITEYLFDLLVTGGDTIIPLVLKCLQKFLQCKSFFQTNNCAYGLINVVRCGHNYLQSNELRAHELETVLKMLNNIMLNYAGSVALFVNESTGASYIRLLTLITQKSNKSLYLLCCQSVTIFLEKFVFYLRPFPYHQLLEFLEQFECVSADIFRRRRSSSTENGSIGPIHNYNHETVLKNRCVFINLHIDFISALIRFATIDRTNTIISEEVSQQINQINQCSFSIFFSTYLRYLMSLVQRKLFLSHLSIDKFIDLTRFILMSSGDYLATKQSFVMIFPQLIGALLTLNHQIRVENHCWSVENLQSVTVNLIEICTLDTPQFIDRSLWRKIISKGIASISDCSINSLCDLCCSQMNHSDPCLASLWLLCSIISMDVADSKAREKKDMDVFDCMEKLCCQGLLNTLRSSPIIFSVKLMSLLKLLLSKSADKENISLIYIKEFIANLCLSLFSESNPELLEYLVSDLSVIKLLNHESQLCMASSQFIISKSFLNIKEICKSDILQILQCNLIDIINLEIVCTDVLFAMNLPMTESVGWVFQSAVTLFQTSLDKPSLQFSENFQTIHNELLCSVSDRLYMHPLLETESLRLTLWQLLEVMFMCPSIYIETVPLLKLTSLFVEYIKNESVKEIELVMICKLIIKASLNDQSSNVRSQLVSNLNDSRGKSVLSIVSTESISLEHQKLVLLSICVLSNTQNCALDQSNKIHLSGRFLLQCIDYCCKIRTSLRQICGLVILLEIFSNRGLIETQMPRLLDPDCLLQTTSIIYTVILDQSDPTARRVAIAIFGQLLRLCSSNSNYQSIEEQIVSSVWMNIIVQHLLTESVEVDHSEFIYNEFCLEFLNQLLESQSSVINLSLPSTTWRTFSVWFVQHSLSSLPRNITLLISKVIFKIATHPFLNCFNESEKICILKKLSTESSDCVDNIAATLHADSVDKGELLLLINNLLG